MVFIEKQKRGRRYFYYLAETLRINSKKFKKIRFPLGSFNEEITKKEEKNLYDENIKQFLLLIDKTSPEKLTDYKIELFWNEKTIFDKNDIEEIENIKKEYQKYLNDTNLDIIAKNNEDFVIRHSYDTNKSEGNTFTLPETEALLKRGIIEQIHKKREVYEIENTARAVKYISEYDGDLTLSFICSIHKIVTLNTLFDPSNEGRARRKGENVKMGENPYICPSGGLLLKKLINDNINLFFKFYKKNPIESIFRFYSSFIALHPFIDGNGRTSRLLLNWFLKRENLPFINFDSREHQLHCNLLNESAKGHHEDLFYYIKDKLLLSRKYF
jgi:Fic family protein